jgi:hypothetical protein
MKIPCLALVTLLFGCINVDNICPHKPITQGVFGEITDSNGTLEQNVEVDVFGTLNGAQANMIGSAETTRGGYEFHLNPSPAYMLCAKTVCTTVAVPTGLVEVSAVDAATGLTWDAPVAVPPDHMIGPCKFGD